MPGSIGALEMFGFALSLAFARLRRGRATTCRNLGHSPVHSKDGRVGSAAPLAAALLVVLYGITLVALGSPSDASATAAQVVAWFGEHRDSVRWSAWFDYRRHAAVRAHVWALAPLASCAASRRFLIGTVIFVVTTAVSAWTWAELVLHADRLEPATARTVLDVAIFFGLVLTARPLR
jgi:hypothetical protein